MNLNNLAKEITLQEGGKINLSVAQVKEVIRLLFIKLSLVSQEELKEVLKRFRPL